MRFLAINADNKESIRGVVVKESFKRIRVSHVGVYNGSGIQNSTKLFFLPNFAR